MVRSMLGEFDGEAAEGRTVEPGEKALDYTACDDLDPAEAGDFLGIEQVESSKAVRGQ